MASSVVPHPAFFTLKAAFSDGVYYLAFYISPSFLFPYLYDFGMSAVFYSYPDPNNPRRYDTNGVRCFYGFATGKIISRSFVGADGQFGAGQRLPDARRFSGACAGGQPS